MVTGTGLAGSEKLAAELFGEGNWAACRRECKRLLAADAAHEQARALDAAATLRASETVTPEMIEEAEATLRALADEAESEEVRNMAGEELDRFGRGDRGKGGSRITAVPAKAVVSLYRAQIGPAIGARCSLEPSCSEYYRQASDKHGLLGVPMQADRFIREPGVVSAGERPVDVDGEIHYEDPVSDHDWWMKRD